MRFLVTGAAGMLGSSLVPALVEAGHEVVAADLDPVSPAPWGAGGPPLVRLDVRDHRAVLDCFKSRRPDHVIHLAALSSIEVCDANPPAAFQTNTVPVKYLAQQCRRRSIGLTLVSTSNVFDGTKDAPYTEADKPNPINTFGISKWEAERIVAKRVERHFIIRAGWLVGGGLRTDGFVSHILNQLHDGASRVYAVRDQIGAPTPASEFARAMIAIIESGRYGTYHVSCEGRASRFEVAEHVLGVLQRDDVEVVEVDSDFFAERFPSARPRFELLANTVLPVEGPDRPRPWGEALRDYLEAEYAPLLDEARAGG